MPSRVAFHACYKWFPDQKCNLPISAINQGSGLGVLTAGIAIPLITAHWGWRANFTAMAIVGLLWTLVWLIFGAEGRIVGNGADAGTATAADATRRLRYRVLLSDPTVLGGVIQNFMAFWGLALTLT